MTTALGVLRELTHSPNRQTDDREVLKAVLAELSSAGLECRLAAPEEFDGLDFEAYDLVLPMCEAYARLARLKARRGGALVVNPAASVLACYRTRMVPLLAACPQAALPPSEVRRVADGPGAEPAFDAPEGWWIKRGDVHNTCDRDVVRLERWSGLAAVLEDFSSREITHFVAQPHVPGDLVKFYGVGPGRWFTWFYHSPQSALGVAFDPGALGAAVAAAARAVDLEVFGGDAIIEPRAGGATGGSAAIRVIDINSWPSFARVRREAAVQIAAHLLERVRGLPPGARKEAA